MVGYIRKVFLRVTALPFAGHAQQISTKIAPLCTIMGIYRTAICTLSMYNKIINNYNSFCWLGGVILTRGAS
jgi:hypothetical protein